MSINKIVNFTMKPGRSLSQKVVKGGFFVLILRIIQQLFTLIKLIIVGRILSPTDFGLLGIALLTITTLETFSQTGFQAALIQTKKDIKSYLDTAWTLSVIRGLFLFVILFFIAPYVAAFFEIPHAKSLIQIIGISLLFQAFTSISVINFQKDLEFNKLFFYQFSGTLIEFIIAVSAVFILRNVWALVFGLLAGNATRCLVSYIIHSFRPTFSLDLEKAKELFRFGKWVLASGILVFLITQGDDIFVGKLIGITALGFYQMAYRISNMPATEITHVISQVTFPAYSKIQTDLPKLREAYLKVIKFTAFLSFPVAGLIFVLSSDFTKIFLGEKWMPMVPAMQVLVFAGLVRSIAATSGYLFYAVAKPKKDMQWQIIRLLVLGVLIYPFANKLGILGVSIVVFLSVFVSNIGFSVNAIKITRCSAKSFVTTLIVPLINGVLLILAVLFSKSLIGSAGVLKFCILAFIGCLMYFLMTYAFDRFFNIGMYALIKENLNSFRGV